jgi:hypothetical protein
MTTPQQKRKKCLRIAPPARYVLCRGETHTIRMVKGSIVLSHHNFRKERAHIELGGEACPCVREAESMIFSSRSNKRYERLSYVPKEDRDLQSLTFSDNINRSYTNPRLSQIHRIIYLLLRYHFKIGGERLRLQINSNTTWSRMPDANVSGRKTLKGYDLLLSVNDNWIEKIWKGGWIPRCESLPLSISPYNDHTFIASLNCQELQTNSERLLVGATMHFVTVLSSKSKPPITS